MTAHMHVCPMDEHWQHVEPATQLVRIKTRALHCSQLDRYSDKTGLVQHHYHDGSSWNEKCHTSPDAALEQLDKHLHHT